MRSIDFDTRDIRHTKYGLKALPFTIVMDLKTTNQLDRFEYCPPRWKKFLIFQIILLFVI